MAKTNNIERDSAAKPKAGQRRDCPGRESRESALILRTEVGCNRTGSVSFLKKNIKFPGERPITATAKGALVKS